MRQFFAILKFELGGYLKNKVFVGITLVLIATIAIVLFYPRVSHMTSNPEVKPQDNTPKEIMLVSDRSSADKNATLDMFKGAMPNVQVELTDKSIAELTDIVNAGEAESAVVITQPTKYTYITKSVGMNSSPTYVIDEIMRTKYRTDAMMDQGISPENTHNILTTQIENEVVQTGKDQMQNFFYTYVLLFALYMAILLYGQLVATSVASEKSSRAMEMLITSAKPANLMFGKVIGSGLAGLTQLAAILGTAFVCFNINKSFWADNVIVNSVFNMPLEMLLYTFLFFILGFFLYAFLFGAVGSLASKVEDINTSSMPIMFLFIIAFMIVITAMTGGAVDSTIMIVSSYVPFTSPIAMFARIAMGEPSGLGIVISIAILIVSTVGIGVISAKIYKVGVLLYGTTPKISNVIKAMKNK